MIRIGASLILIGACCMIGQNFCLMEKQRLKQMKELKKSLLFLKKEMEYCLNSISDAFRQVASRCCEEVIQGIFLQAAADMEEKEMLLESAWERAFMEKNSGLLLSENLLNSVVHIGKNLGYMDLENNANIIDMVLSDLEQAIEEASREMKNKTKVYRTLSLAAGLYLTIIFV